MLFSDAQRDFIGSKPYADPDYEYLDRSARNDAECIRKTMEGWLARYPEQDRPDLIARFCSPDNLQHWGAGFELYLHELLSRLGYALTIHPRTPAEKGTRPDFLAEHESGERFYLEAVQSVEESKQEQSAQARMNIVYDTINRLKSRNFFIGVDYKGLPATPPPGRRLRDILDNWLGGLNADAIADQAEAFGVEGLPKLPYEYDQWKVTFTAIPRAPGRRKTPARAVIGLLSAGAPWLNTSQKIRDSLLTKATKYGELDHCLIIAVNVMAFHFDRIDAMEALFGQELYDLDSPTMEVKMERAPNGLWYGPGGVRNPRVSGVIIGYDLRPWTYGVGDLTYYVDPYAENSVLESIATLSTASISNQKMAWKQGTRPSEILELPQEYPGLGTT